MFADLAITLEGERLSHQHDLVKLVVLADMNNWATRERATAAWPR